jgi:MinD superfamily P-loop ATPase
VRIAVASGKGGTGKTTIATSLAVLMARHGNRVAYVDCDVEEPNGHLFLRPTLVEHREVSIPIPEVDRERCTLCGACGQACRYSAIVVLPTTVLTFPKLCHGCGGCVRDCPEDAIREVPRATGVVSAGASGDVAFLDGTLNVGEAMAPPIIRAVLDGAPADCALVIDSPPGTSCPVIAAVKGADAVLLVTEPTPFGLNDLKLAVGMVRELGLPFGVAVNRAGSGDRAVYDYCSNEQIPLLIEIPHDLAIARACSRGDLAVDAVPELAPRFAGLSARLLELARTAAREPRVRPAAPASGGRNPPEEVQPGPQHLPSDVLRIGPAPDVRELVVISGKGGTGKTSVVASLFALARHAAVADCDVDAADLHLVLDPAVQHRWRFSAGASAVIDLARCTGCGACLDACRFDAIRVSAVASGPVFEVDPVSCEGCGVCVDVCPVRAATLSFPHTGEWFVSDTRHGPMVHARLGIAQENSGKLVSLVRREARAVAASRGCSLLICDGSPGIGCPVIASITGSRMALIVTEPSVSGLHDLDRVAGLCRQFNVKAGVCINKADINPEVSERIDAAAAARGIPVVGRIRYDEAVTAAQIRRLAVVEYDDGPAARDIRALWARVERELA